MVGSVAVAKFARGSASVSAVDPAERALMRAAGRWGAGFRRIPSRDLAGLLCGVGITPGHDKSFNLTFWPAI